MRRSARIASRRTRSAVRTYARRLLLTLWRAREFRYASRLRQAVELAFGGHPLHYGSHSVSVGTILHTRRLTLVPATAAHVQAELDGRHTFAALLGAVVPAGWPPGEYDAAAQQYFFDRLAEAGAAGVGWFGWYGVRRADAAAPATVVAAGGYFGPPTDAGIVELGYSVCAEWRGRGFAAELAGALAAHAARQPGVTRVIAHTTAANPASLRVLARSGFVPAGAGTEPGALRFEYAVPTA